MKKFTLLLVVGLMATAAMAQKYAVINSDYILKKNAKYKAVQEQVDNLAAQYQKEVDASFSTVDEMYRVYQAEKVLLSDELRRKHEGDIIAAEKEAKELQRKYFGPEGTLFAKREELMKPIQDALYKAVKDIADEGGYAVMFDAANNPSLLYVNPRYDKSDDVVKRLGF
ncbi:membrane protein [Bacteroidia bacterium]|nr:membrane protein [Bacteroidia bacterium]